MVGNFTVWTGTGEMHSMFYRKDNIVWYAKTFLLVRQVVLLLSFCLLSCPLGFWGWQEYTELNPCSLHNIVAAFMHISLEHRAAGPVKWCHILLYGNNSFSSPCVSSNHPFITSIITTTHSLHSASPLLSSNRSESWVWHGGGLWDRHLWPSPALCGLHYCGLIVLRDVDNHNRRRAGEPQSSRERGKGEEHWGAAFVWKKKC